MTALHQDELFLDAALVHRLVARSMPQYSTLPVEPLAASGSSNALFRLGEELLVRLPRQPGGSAGIAKEARWLPRIGAGLSTPVPEVVAVGAPGFGYPESWAVTRWIEGRPPSVPWDPQSSGSAEALAADLAGVITELHGIDVPPEALEDPALSWYRGGRLADLDPDVREAVETCRELPGLDLDLTRALRVWEDAVAAERGVAPVPGWYHGDLLAENLLVSEDGRLAAVLDFGGLGVGDPEVDLIVAWEVLDPAGRAAFRRGVGASDGSWARARGWALLIALVTFGYYWESMPARCAARRVLAAAVLDEG